MKTLASEILKFYPPTKTQVSWDSKQLPDHSEDSIRTVTIERDRYIDFRNWYLAAGEFIGVILGNDDWNVNEMDRRYKMIEAHKCPTCFKELDGSEDIYKALKEKWSIIKRKKQGE